MKVLPLLHRFTVDLEKNAAGQRNWSGLAAAESGPFKSKIALAGLTLGDVDIAEASISWPARMLRASQQGRPRDTYTSKKVGLEGAGPN